MCGIVGMAGDIFVNEKKAFRQLLIFDSVRGVHSTGVASVIKESNNVHTYKSVGDPFSLFNACKAFSDNASGMYAGAPKMLLGHNRFATVGKVIAANAHPFRCGKITGCHNGTLSWQGQNNLEKQGKFDVDSEAIFNTIDLKGHEEMLNQIAGAWALVWYNKETEVLHFIRNHERPLYYCRSLDRSTFFWASEEWMLEIALGRSGIKFGDVEQFKANKLHTLFLGDKGDIKKHELVEHEEEYKGFTLPPVTYKVSSHFGGYRGSQTNNDKTTSNTGTHTGTSSSVHPFRGIGQGNAKKLGSLEMGKLKALVGKTIDFYVGTARTSDNRTNYLSCQPVDITEDYDIRLFSDGHARHFEWLKSSGNYTGVVKAIKRSKRGGYPYVLLDMKTISEESTTPFWDKSNERDEKKGTVKGFNGKALTVYEYSDATCNGCAYCSSSITWADAPTVLWLDNKTPICKDCANDASRRTDMALFLNLNPNDLKAN